MAKQDITVDTKKLDRLTIELKGFEDKVGLAAYRALNRTIDGTITQVGRIVPKSYAIKPTEVKESFKGGIKRPTVKDLNASITSWGHTLSLAHFPHTPTKPPVTRMGFGAGGGVAGRAYKVKVTIKKDGGRKTLNTSPLPFIASTGARSPDKTQFNVFRREGKSRLPIVVPRTLSIPQMITNTKVADQIQEQAAQKFEERLEHEIIWAMTSAAKAIEKG